MSPENVAKPATTSRQVSVKVWNWMGGEIKWEAIPLLVDMFEVRDVEALVLDLIVIRNWNQVQKEKERFDG